MLTVFAAVVLLSALLLFSVQPLIGRYILPWFGGSSAVWSAAQLFFQLLLLVGYLYSHLLIRRLPRRAQIWLHVGLIVLAVAVMGLALTRWQTPITPGPGWAPDPDRSPLLQILATLAVSVGLPYFVLSTTSPLLQAWFVARFPGRSPYPLYAISNAGSIVALLAYPLVVEPALTVQGQAWSWSLGFVLFLCGVITIVMGVAQRRDTTSSPGEGDTLSRSGLWWRPFLWVGFSACGTTILLGGTNQMTQNVAAVPLLWVVPLALYLLTFVIAFAVALPLSRWAMGLLLIGMPAFRAALVRANALPIFTQLGTYAWIVFTGCMVSHGELARLRPRADRLTTFYLATSAGGVLGGLFVNLMAPRLFTDFWELPIAVMLCWLLAALALVSEWKDLPRKDLKRQGWSVILALVGLIYGGSILAASVAAFNRATLDAARNFYGTQRVQTMMIAASNGSDMEEPGAASTERFAYRLIHGTTIHGVQYVDPVLRRDPTSYFCPTSGVGMALRQSMRQRPTQRVGVLGLGAGTLAVYGRPGDEMVFYEIDPQVIAYAQGEGGFFSYLADSDATLEIVLGDARLSLARELDVVGSRAFDLLVVDVFSGDSPPVHLLTREALDVYLAHLAPDGLLAMNISTTHVNLKPVIAGLARDSGLSGTIIEDLGDGGACLASRWVVLARRREGLADEVWEAHPRLETAFDPDLRVWTDSYSNLLQIVARPW